MVVLVIKIIIVDNARSLVFPCSRITHTHTQDLHGHDNLSFDTIRLEKTATDIKLNTITNVKLKN